MGQILVVGSSGTVGTELIKELKKLGAQVKAATSKKQNLNSEQVYLDVVSQLGFDQAFTGVDKLFLLSPPGYANQHELLIPLIEKAKQLKLKKVVLMTAMGADAVETAPLRQAELILEKSGLNYNIIRPNWFMQNFNTFWLQGILSARKIFLPVSKAKGSFIDARDIAAVAAKLLTTTEFDKKAFNLTGAEALDHDQVAKLLSEATGQNITYQEISVEDMRAGLLKAGVPVAYTEFLLMILGFFKEGYSAAITTEVEKIIGRKPISFKQYAADYKKSWV